MDLAELLTREGVRDTIARYNASGDKGDFQGLADCFAPDGVLALDGRELVGPAGISAGLRSMLQADSGPDSKAGDPGPADSRPEGFHMHHHVSSLHFVSIGPGEVRTTCYLAVYTPVGLDHWGRYRDRLVPVDDRWLFARRERAGGRLRADIVLPPVVRLPGPGSDTRVERECHLHPVMCETFHLGHHGGGPTVRGST